MISKTIAVLNPSGLHARPASVFVQTLSKFQSSAEFTKDGEDYNAKSIVDLLMACVKCNDVIELRIDGEDEEEAMETILQAVSTGLGEELA